MTIMAMCFFAIVGVIMLIDDVSELYVQIVSVMLLGWNRKAGGICRSFKTGEHKPAGNHDKDKLVHYSLIVQHELLQIKGIGTSFVKRA